MQEIDKATVGSLIPNEATSSFALVFHGKSAVGKSTLISRIVANYGLPALDILPIAKKNVLKYDQEYPNDILLRAIYDDLLIELESGDYVLIENASESAEYMLPKVFDILKKKKRQGILIYCQASLSLARERNNQRKEPVPDWILVAQDNTEKKQVFQPICLEHQIPTISMDFTLSPDEIYNGLLKELKEKFNVDIAC